MKRDCDRWKIKVGDLGIYIQVSWWPDGHPMELFLDTGKDGSELKNMFAMIGKLVSHTWQHGAKPSEIIGQMKEIRTYYPKKIASGHFIFKKNPEVKSIYSAIARVLRHEFKKRSVI